MKCGRTVIVSVEKIQPKFCITKNSIFLAQLCQEPDLNPTISVFKAKKRLKTRM